MSIGKAASVMATCAMSYWPCCNSLVIFHSATTGLGDNYPAHCVDFKAIGFLRPSHYLLERTGTSPGGINYSSYIKASDAFSFSIQWRYRTSQITCHSTICTSVYSSWLQSKCPQWASYQIRKIAGCACAGNAGNGFPRRGFQRKLLVSDPGMHHDTCVTHVPWCMPWSPTCGNGENVPGIPGACAPAILRIWQEAHTVLFE